MISSHLGTKMCPPHEIVPAMQEKLALVRSPGIECIVLKNVFSTDPHMLSRTWTIYISFDLDKKVLQSSKGKSR